MPERIIHIWVLCFFSLIGSAQGQIIDWDASRLVGGVEPGGLNLAHIDAQVAESDGVWITVWRTSPGRDETDGDILFSRSLNAGATWSAPAYLNSDGATDSAVDTFVGIGAGGTTFIAVWHRVDGAARGMYGARSVDGGSTWSTPVAIASATPDVSTSVTPPVIRSDGKGTWIAVGDIDGGLVRVRSTDDGLSWDTPEDLIVRERALKLPDNQDPSIATDEAGNWRIIWSHFGLLASSILDRDIAFSASDDNGVTWSSPAVLNMTMLTDSSREAEIDPTIATDGQGRWIATWSRVDCCGDSEVTPTHLQFSRATANSTLWTDSVALLSFHATENFAGFNSAIAADTNGNWVDVFEGFFSAGSAGDIDISFVESNSNGELWSATGAVNSWAPSDGMVSSDADRAPSIATDSNGQWISVWHSTYSEGSSAGQRVFAGSTQFTGRILGTVRNGTAPISCAAIRIVGTTPDLDVDRVVSTGASGQYSINNLPEGTYSMSLFAPGFSRTSFLTSVSAGLATFAAFQPIPLSGGTRITGTVTDEVTDEPLVGVLVESRVDGILTDGTYTCGSGTYELLDVLTTKGAAGNVELRYTLENYDVRTVGVHVDTNMATNLDTTLMKAVGAPASISGVVVRAGALTGIKGARVTLRGRGRVSRDTDGAGIFSFDAVPEGQYTIVASAAGFVANEVSRAIGLNDSTSLTITLDEGALRNPADINEDGTVNALDIQRIINIVLNLAQGEGDVNGDGQTNAADIQRVIRAVLGLA